MGKTLITDDAQQLPFLLDVLHVFAGWIEMNLLIMLGKVEVR